jgi:hypothetical protein
VKIYLASSFKCKEDYRRLKGILEANGHTITHDWSKDDPSPYEGEDLQDYLMTCAGLSILGIRAAQVVVLLARPSMAGAFVEVGFALGTNVPVIVLDAYKEGNQSNIFYAIPECEVFVHADDEADLLSLLSQNDPYAKVLSIPGNNWVHRQEESQRRLEPN